MTDWLDDADAWLIDKVQDAYLWLFDRTGIYVGVLMFAMCVIDHIIMIAQWGSGPMTLVTAAAGGIWSLQMAKCQKDSKAKFNLIARFWRTSIYRKMLTLMSIWMAVIGLANTPLASLGLVITIVMYGCLPSIYLRDREPPEHHSFAPQGSGV